MHGAVPDPGGLQLGLPRRGSGPLGLNIGRGSPAIFDNFQPRCHGISKVGDASISGTFSSSFTASLARPIVILGLFRIDRFLCLQHL